MGETESLVVIIVGEVLMMLLIPFAGHFSDIVGRRPMWWFSLIGRFVGAMVGFAVLGLLYIPQLSTISATFPAMFPAHVRFAGFAVTYNVFTAAFGGTAASVNEGVVDSTGFLEFPAAYMMGACVIGMIAMLFVKETAGASLHGTEIPESEPQDFGSEAIAEEQAAMDACGR